MSSDEPVTVEPIPELAPAPRTPLPEPLRDGLDVLLRPVPPRTFGRVVRWTCLYFLFVLAACLVFVLMTQVLPAVPVIGLFFLDLMRSGDGAEGGPAELARTLMQRYGMLLLTLTNLSGIVFSCLALRLWLGRQWTRRVGLRAPSAFHVGLILVAFPAVPLLANLVYWAASRVLPSLGDLFGSGMPGMEDVVQELVEWPLLAGILIIGVGPGLSEELWCRGFLGLGLAGRNGVLARVLLASLFFGLIHGDPRQGAMAAVMGLLLHYVYLAGRSLWLPMLLHFLNNSATIVAGHLGGGLEKLDTKPEEIPIALYVGAGFLLAGVLWAFWQTRARLVGVEGGPSPWQPTYPGVEHPPLGSGTVVRRERATVATVVVLLCGALAFAAACVVAGAV